VVGLRAEHRAESGDADGPENCLTALSMPAPVPTSSVVAPVSGPLVAPRMVPRSLAGLDACLDGGILDRDVAALAGGGAH
jgi:hypothetical protein